MPNVGIYFRGTQEEANARRSQLNERASELGLKLVDYLEMLADGRLVAVQPADAHEVPEGVGLLGLLERVAMQVEPEMAEELRRRRQALVEALN